MSSAKAINPEGDQAAWIRAGYAFLLWGGVLGFPVVAAAAGVIGTGSTAISITYRAITAIVAVALMIFARRTYRLNGVGVTLVASYVFWVLYLARIAHETSVNPFGLAREPIIYWTFAVGSCFVPMTALAFRTRQIEPDRLLTFFLGGAILVIVASLLVGSTMSLSSEGAQFDAGRFGLESLNPISFGHMGATAALLAYWAIRSLKLRWNTLLYGACFALGIYAVIVSASRGPFIAMISGILFVEIARPRATTALVVAMLAVCVALMGFDVYLIDDLTGTKFVERLMDAVTVSGGTDLEREISFHGAWEQFLRNPMTGDALEERITGFYPHNIVLEALMATGVVGGGALLVAIGMGLKHCVTLLRAQTGYGWIAILYVQYLIGSQTSGAVYTATTFWALHGAVIGLTAYSRRPATWKHRLPLQASFA